MVYEWSIILSDGIFGGCTLIPREVFLKMNGFDETRPLYEIAFTKKLRRLDLNPLYSPFAHAVKY